MHTVLTRAHSHSRTTSELSHYSSVKSSTHPVRKGLGECRTVVNLGTKEQNSLTPGPDRCEKPP